MKECFPTELAHQPEVITPSLLLGDRAEESLRLLAKSGAYAATGLTDEVLPMVQAVASEQKIAEYCPNDIGSVGGNGRFASVAHAQSWIAKGRGFIGIYSIDSELLAYGWSGPETNLVLPDAKVTTAYRVGSSGSRLARAMRREEYAPNFSMGLALGELVIATAVYLHGAKPSELSLETWESNQPARTLYDKLGFGLRKVMRSESRPTLAALLYPSGQVIDRRCHYQLINHPVIEQETLAKIGASS